MRAHSFYRCLVVFSRRWPCPLPRRIVPPGLQTAFARAQHLKHGINAAEWFAQSANDYSAARTNRYTDAQRHCADGQARLRPCAPEHRCRSAGAVAAGPDGLNADFLARLDRAVDTMLANGLAVEIDLHPEDAYKQQLRTSDDAVDRLTCYGAGSRRTMPTATRSGSSSRS